MDRLKFIKYFKRCKNSISLFPLSAKEFGFKLAFTQLRKVMSVISPEKYVQIISKYMIRELEELISGYNIRNTAPKMEIGKKIPIWVCWLQGESNMPEICKACLNRMRKIIPSEYQIIVLTYDNYLSYVDIPDDIIQKHKCGFISAPNYSDIIRFGLLSMYGGVWLDATIYLTKDIISKMTEKEFYTAKFYKNNNKIQDASRGIWTGFLLSSHKNCIVSCFTYDALKYYWRKHNVAIDYLAVDYIIWAGYSKIPLMRQVIDSVPNNNENFDLLNQLMEKPVQEETLDIIKVSNGFYKINRHKFYLKKTSNGLQTIYSYIIENNLDCEEKMTND